MSSRQIRERVHSPCKTLGDDNTKIFEQARQNWSVFYHKKSYKKGGECAVHRTIQKQKHLTPGIIEK